MKRTTVFLDEALERRLKQLARREGKSFAQCVREAVAAYVARPAAGKRPLPGFFGIASEGEPDLSDRVDEVLAEIWDKQGPHS
jgi:hypothetical protein